MRHLEKLYHLLSIITLYRSSNRRCFLRKGVLRNLQQNTCTRVFSIKVQDQVWNFIKIETLAQVFCCEFWEISMNIFFYRKPQCDCFGLYDFTICTGMTNLLKPLLQIKFALDKRSTVGGFGLPSFKF